MLHKANISITSEFQCMNVVLYLIITGPAMHDELLF
jgi:hypothetical protein